MSRTVSSMVAGIIVYPFGMALAAGLVSMLFVAVGTTGDPRGGVLVFKIAWSAAITIAPVLATVCFLAAGIRLRLDLGIIVLSVICAFLLYALTAWVLATPLSVVNDCQIGVTWPDTSVAGCD